MSTSEPSIICARALTKTYKGGHQALKGIDLDIRPGEILALLGPNGAGKTTLISTICGLVTPTSGTVSVAGHDIIKHYRQTRKLIGLVPQELTLGAFDVVVDTVRFSRGLFGLAPDHAKIDKILDDLSLSDKRNTIVSRLSGGMKRRVLIAKALAHEPRILFLDEPSAIILTTHYIEEAEEIADRVGVISDGRLLVIDEKQTLMSSLGKKQLMVELRAPIEHIPPSLDSFNLELSADGQQLTYTFDTQSERTGITALLQSVNEARLGLKDLNTSQSSLEDIFVNLVSTDNER